MWANKMSSEVENGTAVMWAQRPVTHSSAVGEQSDGRCSLVKSGVCLPDSFPEGLAGTLDEWETGVRHISSLLEGLGIPLFVWTIKQWGPAASVSVTELQKGGNS